MPGSHEKYISLLTFLGYTCDALGGITTIRSGYSKGFVLNRYVYLKAAAIVLIQGGNVGSVISQPLVLEISQGNYAAFIVGFVLWAMLDTYFMFILRSYGAESDQGEQYRIQSINQSLPEYPVPPTMMVMFPREPPIYPATYPPPMGIPVIPAREMLPPPPVKSQGKSVLSPPEEQKEPEKLMQPPPKDAF